MLKLTVERARTVLDFCMPMNRRKTSIDSEIIKDGEAQRTDRVRQWHIAAIMSFSLSVLLSSCGAGGGANGPAPTAPSGVAPGASDLIQMPIYASPTRSQPASFGGVPMAFGSNAPAPLQRLCIANRLYTTTMDDEFTQDQFLDAVPVTSSIDAPANASHLWGTNIWWLPKPAAPTVQDEFDTDTTVTPYYNPFLKAADGSLMIQAVPIPAAHQSDAMFSPTGGGSGTHPFHYLSGMLNGHPHTYGYVEVSAKVDHAPGFWTVPAWLLGHNGADGNGNGYSEFDLHETFGSVRFDKKIYAVAQTWHNGPSQFQTYDVPSPDDSESYHSYGVLWTPDLIAFFVDRALTGGPYGNVPENGGLAATGPMSPLITLQVYAKDQLPPPPLPGAVAAMYLKYYRWYQITPSTCFANDVPAHSDAPGDERND